MIGAIFGLYNYWVVVLLMMTGFYIVIASRNLIKSVIGLNIFQTSVFLLYITMGKMNGATAPIIPAEFAASHGHAEHGEVEMHGHQHESIHDDEHSSDSHHNDSSHAKDAHHTADHHGDDHHSSDHHKTDHHKTAHHDDADHGTGHVDSASPLGSFNTSYSGMTGVDAGHVTYSNPLPSVLMLTAIVVGIATTALALALIVRIREDYGTVEEDEIMEMDLTL